MDAEAAAKARQCYLFFAALDQLKIDATAPAVAATTATAIVAATGTGTSVPVSAAAVPSVPSTIVDAMATDA